MILNFFLSSVLCTMFRIIVFFIITLFALLYVRFGIVLACGEHLHDRIISLREDVWARKTSLNLQPFVEVPSPEMWILNCSDSVVFFCF